MIITHLSPVHVSFISSSYHSLTHYTFVWMSFFAFFWLMALYLTYFSSKLSFKCIFKWKKYVYFFGLSLCVCVYVCVCRYVHTIQRKYMQIFCVPRHCEAEEIWNKISRGHNFVFLFYFIHAIFLRLFLYLDVYCVNIVLLNNFIVVSCLAVSYLKENVKVTSPHTTFLDFNLKKNFFWCSHMSIF